MRSLRANSNIYSGRAGVTEIYVRASNKEEDTEFLWNNEKFTTRYFGMQELYQNYSEGYNDWDVPKVYCIHVVTVIHNHERRIVIRSTSRRTLRH